MKFTDLASLLHQPFNRLPKWKPKFEIYHPFDNSKINPNSKFIPFKINPNLPKIIQTLVTNTPIFPFWILNGFLITYKIIYCLLKHFTMFVILFSFVYSDRFFNHSRWGIKFEFDLIKDHIPIQIVLQITGRYSMKTIHKCN
jgi:hypothetical protein